MPIINATDRPLLWAVLQSNVVIESGVTVAGNTTISVLTFASNADENTFLGLVAGKAGTYKPLPSAGAWLTAGEIYGYGGGLVIVRQSHVRTAHAPADVPALFSVYRAGGGTLEWVANERVEIGTRRTYSGTLYEAMQAHTTQTDWTPVATLGTLWRAVVTTPDWTTGVAYKVGDVVLYQGNSYRCLQAHTSISTWNPVATINVLWVRI